MKKPILKKVMALSMAATMLCLTACGNAGTQSEAPVESAEKTSDTTAVVEADRKSTRLNSSHNRESRMPSSA